MSDIKWFKIKTDIFHDEKIKFIESLPDSDTIIVVWFKILALTAKSNNDGFIMLTDSIPYTEEMLVSYVNRKSSVVKSALQTFEKLNMIEITDQNAIMVSNWSKHQNVKGLEKIREQNRIRQKNFRERHNSNNNKVLDLKDKEQEKERDIDIDTDNATNNVTGNVTEKSFKDFVVWFKKNYRGKKTKKARDTKLPKILKKHDEEELKRSVERYMKEMKGKEIQFIKHEGTWWNGGYIDYLDENYEPTNNDRPKKKYSEHKTVEDLVVEEDEQLPF